MSATWRNRCAGNRRRSALWLSVLSGCRPGCGWRPRPCSSTEWAGNARDYGRFTTAEYLNPTRPYSAALCLPKTPSAPSGMDTGHGSAASSRCLVGDENPDLPVDDGTSVLVIQW